LAEDIWSPYEGQSQQKADFYIEIDKLWKLMMKKSIWGYHGMKKEVNHKLQLVERDYINRVIGKKKSKLWDPRRLQIAIRKQQDK